MTTTKFLKQSSKDRVRLYEKRMLTLPPHLKISIDLSEITHTSDVPKEVWLNLNIQNDKRRS